MAKSSTPTSYKVRKEGRITLRLLYYIIYTRTPRRYRRLPFTYPTVPEAAAEDPRRPRERLPYTTPTGSSRLLHVSRSLTRGTYPTGPTLRDLPCTHGRASGGLPCTCAYPRPPPARRSHSRFRPSPYRSCPTRPTLHPRQGEWRPTLDHAACPAACPSCPLSSEGPTLHSRAAPEADTPAYPTPRLRRRAARVPPTLGARAPALPCPTPPSHASSSRHKTESADLPYTRPPEAARRRGWPLFSARAAAPQRPTVFPRQEPAPRRAV